MYIYIYKDSVLFLIKFQTVPQNYNGIQPPEFVEMQLNGPKKAGPNKNF